MSATNSTGGPEERKFKKGRRIMQGTVLYAPRIDGPTPMGHEYCGVVEEVGSAVKSVKPGQFVVGSFATSDNTCANCRYGYQSSCVHREFMLRAQAPFLRVPLADGTLVPTPGVPSDDLVPSGPSIFI